MMGSQDNAPIARFITLGFHTTAEQAKERGNEHEYS